MHQAVFTPKPLNGYEIVEALEPSAYEYLAQAMNGVRRGRDWMPIEVRLVTTNGSEALLQSDAPYLTAGLLVLRADAANNLGGVLDRFAEVLPLTCTDADLVAINVTCVLDALDVERSAVARLPSGRIFQVFHHAFRPEVVAGRPIFKIPDLRVSPIFVDESFVKAWSDAGLSGLAFPRAWEGSMSERT
jgi:hypothetical protein